jgi:hypothetical protein
MQERENNSDCASSTGNFFLQELSDQTLTPM